jgi:hypothetical protein
MERTAEREMGTTISVSIIDISIVAGDCFHSGASGNIFEGTVSLMLLRSKCASSLSHADRFEE